MNDERVPMQEEMEQFIRENISSFTLSKPEDFVMSGNTLVKYKGSATIVEIPNNISTIAKKAFLGTDIICALLPEGLIRIEKHAFQLCKNLMVVRFPSTLRFIGESAFSSCPLLSNVKLPQEMDEIERFVFCKSGLTKITLPKRIVRIGEGMLSDCNELEMLEIPGGIRTVPIILASDCLKLQKVVFEDGVENVEIAAFRNCPTLQEISVPDSLNDISRAFGRRHSKIQVSASESWKVQHSDTIKALENRK